MRSLMTALLTAVVCGLIASVLPPRLRLLLLFPLAQGLAAGWVWLRMGSQGTAGNSARRAIVTGCGITAGCLAFVVTSLCWWQSYRMDLERESRQPDAGSGLALRILAQAPDADESDPEAARAAREFRTGLEQALAERQETRRQRSTFSGWLGHHARGLKFARTWPVALWSVELLLAGLSGGAIVLLMSPSHPQPAADSESPS
jgi:hypothetical protein